jgi:hypothetical protein
MTRLLAQRLMAVQVPLLIAGTQMPGAWRAGAVAILHAPGSISSWAHFVLFADMATMALARPLLWPSSRVVLWALGLALLSEGLQFFAMDRHPRWLDVCIDMSAALAGMLLAMLINQA